MQHLHKKKFEPVYVIDGEETFYIDRITEFFEQEILTDAEKDFNLLTLYGKESNWVDVVNACRRFPMFAEKQVVILKDAAQMQTLNELVAYLEKPSPTTIFLLEHRFKKIDGRSKLATVAAKAGVAFTSEKIKDDALPAWIQHYGHDIDFQIGVSEAQLLAGFLGNDVQKIVNEIEKVRINVPNEKVLTGDLIQKYIGISRDYNIFEMPVAYTSGNWDKMIKMLKYFIANPKSAVMPVVIGSFTSHLSQLLEEHYNKRTGQKSKWRPDDFKMALANFSLPKTEKAILIVGEYSAKTVGIGTHLDGTELLMEMIGRLQLIY